MTIACFFLVSCCSLPHKNILYPLSKFGAEPPLILEATDLLWLMKQPKLCVFFFLLLMNQVR